ncbi:hypothetical protein ABB37_09899 [Leptomonas pyrrhocoris]|uniref:Uncharacterized protein n=1 Tax=Leptomonas pyrrhocoris TaxID=157538 RepID=A0A0M9FPC3_LEPPY|nr:hypothetical protein ABB37_09899 [Leptomonas pyrrhocoris]KPA73340.1 hypothetical protein ABB37_09899 [Leptomonas pyrrhocoris]|eukprot:XP_015651779.1 hypothetical protein ABB37_09899 [Leptomonas pyrrhocoris]
MKLPKIVTKKNAHRVREAHRLAVAERRAQQQQHRSSLSAGLNDASAAAASGQPRSDVRPPRTRSKMGHHRHHGNGPSQPPGADLSRSGSSTQDFSVHSALSSDDNDDLDDVYTDSSGSEDASRSSHSSNDSFFSDASSRASSRRSSSASLRSNSRTVAAAGAATSPSKPPSASAARATQYSAYARSMNAANRQRTALAYMSSAVNFDGADAFFDKSDSSLGTGSGASSPTRADDDGGATQEEGGEGDASRHSDDDGGADEGLRPLYRSTVPTGRRMTQNEVRQRQLLREAADDTALVTSPQRKRQLQPQRRRRTSSLAGDVGRDVDAVTAAVAEVPSSRATTARGGADRTAVSAAAAPARRRSSSASASSASRSLKDQSLDVTPLTATSSTVPVPSEGAGRLNSKSANHSGNSNSRKVSPPSDTEKRSSWIFGWKRRLLLHGAHTNKNDSTSPSSRSTSKLSLSAHSSVSSPQRSETTSTRRNNVGVGHGNPSAHAATSTPRVGGGSTSSAPASTVRPTAPAAKSSSSFSVAVAVAPASTTLLPRRRASMTKETLRSLDGTQLSRLDFSEQKARRTTSTAPAEAGPLSSAAPPSLMAKGGYGSFMDVFASASPSDDDNGAADEVRSNGSRRSSSSRRRKAPPPPSSTPAHYSSFFRALFRSSSSGLSYSRSGTPRLAPADKADDAKRARRTTADADTASNEKSRAPERQASRQRLARTAQSPVSAVGGVATSLYRFDDEFSLGRSSSSSSFSSSAADNHHHHHHHDSSNSRDDATGGRRRGNLPGSTRRSDEAAAHAAAGGVGDSFGSLFNGDGTVAHAAAPPAAAALYGTPNVVPAEAGSAPTPGAGSMEVALGHIEKRNVPGDAAEASPLLSPQQPLPPQQTASTTHTVVLFPQNSFPRSGAAAATATAAAAASASSRAIIAGSVDNGTTTGPNMFGAAWLRQHHNVLSQLDPSVQGASASPSARASTAAFAPSATAAAAGGGDGGGGGASQTAVRSNSRSSSTLYSPMTRAAGSAAMGLQGSKTVDGRPATVSTATPMPVYDELTTSSSSPTATAAVSPAPKDKYSCRGSLEGGAGGSSSSPTTAGSDVASQEPILSGEYANTHSQRHRIDSTSASSATAVMTVDEDAVSRDHRRSSLLSLTDGYYVRRRTSGGNSSSSNNAKVAHPPSGAPPSNDPRRSDSGRQGGSSTTVVTAAAAVLDGSCEQGRNLITLKPARNSSASLLPQPPTLSNTESKNYRGGSGTYGSGGSGGGVSAGGSSFNTAIASLQTSDDTLPTRADSKDFLLRHPHDGRPTVTTTNTAAVAALTRQSSHESSGLHRLDSEKRSSGSHHHHHHHSHRRSHGRSNGSSGRHNGSFSFSSESLLDGRARGRLAKAAAASNAASNSVERRRATSTHSLSNNNGSNTNNKSLHLTGSDGPGDGAVSRRHQSRDRSSTSSRSSQNLLRSCTPPRHRVEKAGGGDFASGPSSPRRSRHLHRREQREGESERRRHSHRGGPRRPIDPDASDGSGSQRRLRSRSDLNGSSRRPSSASVSLVAGLDEVLPHKPMQPRNTSSSISSSTAAASSRNSSTGSTEHRGEPVGRSSVRCLRRMAAKARDVSNSSSCDLDAAAHNTPGGSNGHSKSDNVYHPHSTAMPQQPSEQNSSNSGPATLSPQLARGLVNSGSASATAPVVHFPGITALNGSGTLVAHNPNGDPCAMKLPLFKQNMVVERSSSSNDVNADRPVNNGGLRQQQQQQYSGNEAVAALLFQCTPLTLSHEGSGNQYKGSGSYVMQPARPQGSNGNGRALRSTNNGEGSGGRDKEGNDINGSGGDRVTTSGEPQKGLNAGMNSSGGATMSLVHKQLSLGGVSSVGSSDAAAPLFFGEGNVRTSVSSALLTQPRDSSTKRRRPATASFTPWSVDLSRFDKLREQQNASTAAAD